MKKILLFSALLLIFIAGCKEKEENFTELWFEETQCANPWPVLPETENYLPEIESFLESEGILIYAIGREKVEDPQPCDACLCLTGYIIVIRVQESDVARAAQFEFIRPDLQN